MSSFSNTSLNRLSTCEEDLQILFKEVVKTFDCTVLEGHRSIERQQELYNQGRSQIDGIKKKGMHNYSPSRGVDVIRYPIDWDDTNTHYFFAGYVLGIAQKLYDEGKMKHRIRCGADWDGDKNIHNQSFNDLVHFEIIK